MAGRNGKTKQVTLDERVTWVDREVRPILRGRALTTDVKDMSVAETADAWQMLDLLRTKIEKRQKELRAVLLSAAERDGSKTDGGSCQLTLNGATIERQVRVRTEPDKDGMMNLLARKGLTATDVYDEVRALVYNPSKTEFLIDTGKISEEDVNALRDKTHALRVNKSDDWLSLFDEAGKKVRRKQSYPARTSVR